MADHGVLLEVCGLKVHFPIKSGLLRRVTGSVKAVDGVDFLVREGETLGLVGESGCGKTSTGRAVARRIPAAGRVEYRARDGTVHSLLELEREQLKELRRDIQVVFQDPYASLNPRMTVGTIVGAPLVVYGIGDREGRR